MAVSREEVRRIAELARLRLDDDEEARLAGELDDILEHVAALGELDVAGVEGLGGMAEGGAPFRDEGREPDALLRPPEALAPGWSEGLFVVPRLEALDDDGAPDAGGAP